MNLHTPRRKPDWEQKDASKINRWQRLAVASNGIITPGNLISISGVILVAIGAIRLYNGNWVLGLGLVVIGRVADLVDGYVAETTRTKSRLGEIVDTSCDKVGVFVLAITAVSAHLVPLLTLALIVAYNIYMAAFGIVWGRRYYLHTNRFGKNTMFVSWLAIITAIIHAELPNNLTLTLSLLFAAIFVAVALVATYSYGQDLRKAAAKRLQNADWVQDITDVLQLYNPRASNYPRANKLFEILCTRLDHTPQRYDITKDNDQLVSYLGSCTDRQTILVTIAGGDGTVSSVINTLIEHMPKKAAPRLYVLPLWGGNANDLSYMLNGLHTSVKQQRLLSTSSVVSIPFIKVDLAAPHDTRTVYACCYASFGASAYAARQLDAQRFSAQKAMRWFPPLLVLRELLFVIRAFLLSPLHVVEINNRETVFYEHTIINGSRIAKVNRVPIELDEPTFFHALVERKDPSILITVARALLGRPDTLYAKKTNLSFTIKKPLDAQIDGEMLHLTENTKVTASVTYASSISFISTRLH